MPFRMETVAVVDRRANTVTGLGKGITPYALAGTEPALHLPEIVGVE